MKVIPLYPTYNEANCYIVANECEGQNLCAVIDPGANADRIYKRAAANGLKIQKILLTHAHFDHIMAVNELVALTGAGLVIHKDDLQALYEPALNLSGLGTGRNYIINSDVCVTTVTGGDKIAVGNEFFDVISTPGHTPGSCCFMCGDVIFTGDTLFANNIGRTDFPGGSIAKMKESLKKLVSLEGDFTLYPGHSSETTLPRELKFNYYLQSSFTDGNGFELY